MLGHEFPGNSREVPANLVFLFWKDREWYHEAKSVNNEDSRGMSREAERSRQNGLLFCKHHLNGRLQQVECVFRLSLI